MTQSIKSKPDGQFAQISVVIDGPTQCFAGHLPSGSPNRRIQATKV